MLSIHIGQFEGLRPKQPRIFASHAALRRFRRGRRTTEIGERRGCRARGWGDQRRLDFLAVGLADRRRGVACVRSWGLLWGSAADPAGARSISRLSGLGYPLPRQFRTRSLAPSGSTGRRSVRRSASMRASQTCGSARNAAWVAP